MKEQDYTDVQNLTHLRTALAQLGEVIYRDGSEEEAFRKEAAQRINALIEILEANVRRSLD